MITKKYYEREGDIIRLLAWKREIRNGQNFTSFTSETDIFNISVPRDFRVPSFIEAEITEEKPLTEYTLILAKFKRYISDIPVMPRTYGFVVHHAPQRILIDKRGNIMLIPDRYTVLTTSQKKFCIATSLIDNVHTRDIVSIAIDAEIQKDKKNSMRGVIIKKFPFSEGLKRIEDKFGPIREFFKNIEKK